LALCDEEIEQELKEKVREKDSLSFLFLA